MYFERLFDNCQIDHSHVKRRRWTVDPDADFFREHLAGFAISSSIHASSRRLCGFAAVLIEVMGGAIRTRWHAYSVHIDSVGCSWGRMQAAAGRMRDLQVRPLDHHDGRSLADELNFPPPTYGHLLLFDRSIGETSVVVVERKIQSAPWPLSVAGCWQGCTRYFRFVFRVVRLPDGNNGDLAVSANGARLYES